MRILVCLPLLASLLWATDLSKIERKIKVAPKFTAEQQFYALLVLGAEAEKHVWFVIDGDALYVDKNGNGDLTDDGEKIQAPPSMRPRSVLMSRSQSWKLPLLGERYSDIKVDFGQLSKTWRPSPTASNRAHMQRFVETVAKTPHANITSIYVTIDGKRTQFCNAMFRTSAETAPIFHMDGPLTLGTLATIMPARLGRGEKPRDLKLAVGTPGFGGDQPGCFSYVMYSEFPKDVRPVIEVKFPNAKGDGYLPSVRLDMKGKC